MTDDIEWTTHLHDGSAECPVPGDTLVRFWTDTKGEHAKTLTRMHWYGALAYQIGTPRKPEVIEDQLGKALGILSDLRDGPMSEEMKARVDALLNGETN